MSKQKSSPLVASIFNKEVTIRNTVSKQCNVISMGLSKQKSSPIDSYRNLVQNIEHTRKQVILLKTLLKQLNAIPMGLSKQKSSIEI